MMRFFNFIFILTKCQANMCEGVSDSNQVGSLNRHYRELYDYPAKILCSATFQYFKIKFKFPHNLFFVFSYYSLCYIDYLTHSSLTQTLTYSLCIIENENAKISFLKRYEEFYQKHHHAEGKSVYFAGGAESVIYKCSTDDKLSNQGGFIYEHVNVVQPRDARMNFYNLYLTFNIPRTEIPVLFALVL